MHLFNCQVLLNFVKKLRCPIYSLTIVALSMGMSVSLLKMVVLFLLTWQLINWTLGYTLKFNFISCQVVGLLAKLEHLISSLLLEIFTSTLQINEALLSMANEKIFF
jgi:hypothetical protein